MAKKVLILSSSPRKGGNSETLAAAFAKARWRRGIKWKLCICGKSSMDSARAVWPA